MAVVQAVAGRARLLPYNFAMLDRLESHVDVSSPEFRKNHERMSALVAELRDRSASVRQGGGEKYIERHRAQGKLPARDRISKLLDPGSPFLELSRRGSSQVSAASPGARSSSSPTTRRSKGAPTIR